MAKEELNLIPYKTPLAFSFPINKLIPSMTDKKSKGDNRQPYLKSLDAEKKLVGEPLIKTEKIIKVT